MNRASNAAATHGAPGHATVAGRPDSPPERRPDGPPRPGGVPHLAAVPEGPPVAALGGTGWDLADDADALARLGEAVDKVVRPTMRELGNGVMGRWPHLAVARADFPNWCAAVVRVGGTAWCIPPSTPNAAPGVPFVLGELSAEGDLSALAAVLVEGLYRGRWQGPTLRAVDGHTPPPAAGPTREEQRAARKGKGGK